MFSILLVSHFNRNEQHLYADGLTYGDALDQVRGLGVAGVYGEFSLYAVITPTIID